MSAMAWTVSRQEKGAGLMLIAAALLLHPLALIGMLIVGINTYQLRNIVVVPISVFGMALFAISLTRARVKLEHELAARVEAQAALQHLNESLEHRVAQRTEELHDMVAGLESFNRSVSHDLRGPLGGVATLTRLAIDAIGRGEIGRALTMLDAVAGQADSLERHGGSVWAEGRPGQGASFYVSLRAAHVD
jgi:signal transduction histidine kinase